MQFLQGLSKDDYDRRVEKVNVSISKNDDVNEHKYFEILRR